MMSKAGLQMGGTEGVEGFLFVCGVTVFKVLLKTWISSRIMSFNSETLSCCRRGVWGLLCVKELVDSLGCAALQAVEWGNPQTCSVVHLFL